MSHVCWKQRVYFLLYGKFWFRFKNWIYNWRQFRGFYARITCNVSDRFRITFWLRLWIQDGIFLVILLYFSSVSKLIFRFKIIGFGNDLINFDLSFFSLKAKSEKFDMIGHGIKFVNGCVKVDIDDVFVPFQSLNDFLGLL